MTSMLDEAPDSATEGDAKGMGKCRSFGMILNVIIGTGFFAIPHAYYKSGLPLSIIATVLATGFGMLGAVWTLETVSRSRGFKYAKSKQLKHKVFMNKITSLQIEFSESMGIFCGKIGAAFCHIVMLLYALGSLWAYVSMFSSIGASITMQYILKWEGECIIEDNPSFSCRTVYSFFVALLCALMIGFESFNMNWMSHVQSFFMGYRVVAFLLIALSCIVSLVVNGNKWTNSLQESIEKMESYHSEMKMFGFNWSGFPTLFSAVCFAFNCAYNLPSIVPLMGKERHSAGCLTVVALVVSGTLYLGLGVLLAVTLGPSTREFVILNWADFGQKGFQMDGQTDVDAASQAGKDGLKIPAAFAIAIKLTVMLFPMANILSVFPLIAGSVGFSFFSSFPDHFKKSYGRAGPLLLRYLVTLPPFLLALFFPSLDVVIEFCGLSAVFLVVFIPALLQFESKRKCGTEWGTPYSGWWSHGVFIGASVVYGIVALSVGICELVANG
ncbi:putative amino acid transporter [Monocercomonoides exilis]|uniref:putative amino acid transporter n=1 Tax=Monocercomonoides exilis TaxID=2049356 RepID=UPI00355AB6F3|nr:putative amino acid transporter [Monocercomonoides exilis]|eukprot:MONOS_10985.1-p1 / transcript=MONOS_10985.1 / gene=MONOS_10985 / organism=Monocercomonoides_exilis_PA203 / gene_product=amino acid transporter, putative / transcript_product=amino acid transporter, putative / location=Mono_scaffold00525:24783-26475(+) / protein_length=497 / sequence_SO=supercontig / SO=protein_coding / is_pseudo=false